MLSLHVLKQLSNINTASFTCLLLHNAFSNDSLADELDESPSASPRATRPTKVTKATKKEEDTKVEDQKLGVDAKDDAIIGTAASDDQTPKQEQQQQQTPCPVPGCDSRGHLSGMYERHSARIACPTFHNTTPEECVEKCNARREREEKRRQAMDGDK